MYNLQSLYNGIVKKSNDDNIDMKVHHRRIAELELHSADQNIGKVSITSAKFSKDDHNKFKSILNEYPSVVPSSGEQAR